jgi:hypothetical protein
MAWTKMTYENLLFAREINKAERSQVAGGKEQAYLGVSFEVRGD